MSVIPDASTLLPDFENDDEIVMWKLRHEVANKIKTAVEHAHDHHGDHDYCDWVSETIKPCKDGGVQNIFVPKWKIEIFEKLAKEYEDKGYSTAIEIPSEKVKTNYYADYGLYRHDMSMNLHFFIQWK